MARRAGTMHARNATASMVSVTPANVNPSVGPTSNRNVRNTLAAANAPGTPVLLATPVFNPALGEVAYYLVACDQCGGLFATGISRLGGSDTERLVGPACTICP